MATGYKLSAAAAAREAQWDASRGVLPLSSDRPSPEPLTDGRFWGDEDWIAALGLPTEANKAETAARVSAVAFCVGTIADVLGSFGIDLLDRELRTVESPLVGVLGEEPNHIQTAPEFWSSMAYVAALEGMAIAEPVVGFDQVELWPLDPLVTKVDWKYRRFTVETWAEGRLRHLVPSQLFWFGGLADATMKPLVPWKMAKGSIDFQLALEVGGRQFFRNNRRLGGILSTEQALTEEGIEHIRSGIARWKRGGIPVLEQGLKYQDVAGSNEDAQLAELIRQRTLEMARYWRIPKSMIGEDGGTAASQEQQALEFVKYTMRPWVRRIEKAISARLLPPDMKAEGIRAKFNMEGLLRGDSATQFRNAVLARTAGTHSQNELRTGWFGMPRIEAEWADDPRAPLNSNRAADGITGGETAPQDKVE
ncbi:phage portal protein [Tsuneonella sp. HG094]